MAIIGTHMLFYTPEAESLRAFLRDAIGWEHVDANEGWLIFKLPPAELGVHPSEGSTKHELCLMCDDISETLAELSANGAETRGEPEEMRFGIGTTLVLPGGVEVLLYEPAHASPLDLPASS